MNQASWSRLSLIFVGLMGVVPFLQWKHYYPITDFYTEWVAAFLGICALACNCRRLSRLPLVSLVPLALMLLIWVQFLLGRMIYPQQAALASLYLVWGALLAMLGYALKDEFGLEKIARTMAWFILAGGLASGVAAVLQHYFDHAAFGVFVTPDASGGVYGNLAQQNHFSDYTALAIASLLYLAASRKIHPLAALPLGGFLLFMLALSGSRSAWLYLAALTVLALLLHGRQRNGVLLTAALLLVPAFALMQFLAHFSFMGGHGTLTSGDRLLVIGRDSGIRFYLWREAWMMFLKSPLLGVGFGQFAWHHFGYGPAFNDPQITGLYSNAHDIAFHLLAETGLAGVLLVFGGIFFWARRIDIAFDIHAWWLFAVLLVIALHSLDEYPLWYAHFLGIFMLLLGMGEARSLRLPGAQGVTILLLAAGSYLMAGLMKDYLDLEGLLYPSYHNGKPPLRPAALYDALYRFRKGTLLVPYVEYPMAEMLPVDETNLDDKLRLSRRALHFSPSGMLVYRRAALLALAGREAAAKLEIRRAASSDPDLLEDALDLYSDLAGKEPGKFEPLVEEVKLKLKERNFAFHHQ